ncbi:3-oxo-5-alpha-steroid 4-dehydrogenase 1-like [Paramacrobiotus metropolitanus]|uniref:3-oxo-5-alpha-steroid 4-dehydrogenase 1-like n=1 Tax=Paramacrobiotus metropolitanus TaxID=2943436 RepID=UPI0024462C1E|nr:3-oxo-5-alpha-steroid 4-dehydrogenase 1-like [Paramacrobiotus metropolitanus]XP_055353355.1 3-oxo-5-alpha-steroid 4-dehydrogenase 1-like [Paramacrobiotus metropolitanus]
MEDFANQTLHLIWDLVRRLGSDAEKPTLDAMALVMIAVGLVTYVALQLLPAPYGRYSSPSYGLLVPARIAWVVQECPAFFVPLYVWLYMDNGAPALANKILAGLFMLHYFQRTFFYSFLIRGGKPTPLAPFLMAFVFCTYNGYMQARSILKFRGPIPDVADPVFLLGVALFVVGLLINIQSDHILRNLRSDGSKAYKIPYGGMFDYITAANFFGEIVEWWGFALAAWQLQGFAFAIFTMANLVPRGLSHHAWYLNKFRGEYPVDRYAVLPPLV